MEAPRQHSQLSPLWLRFDEELQLQVLNKLEANMEAPERQHIQPSSKKQLSVNEPQLKQTSMKPPRSYHSHLHLNFNKHPPERGGQLPKKFQAILPAPVRSQLQPQRPLHYPPLTINEDKASYKGKFSSSSIIKYRKFSRKSFLQRKEKETSSTTYVQSLMPATNEPLDRGSFGNQGRLNILSPTQPEQENRHEIPPPRSDITLNTGLENKIVWNAISDVNRALQACSPPGADIHWPHGEMDKPLFDIPFLSAPVIDLDPEPSAHDREAPTSGMDDEKPRRRGPDKGMWKPRGPRKQ